MIITQGDLKPDFVAVIADADGPLDLTLATDVEVVGRIDGTIVVDHNKTDGVTVYPDGRVVMTWGPTDTTTVGQMLVEVIVHWPDGPQTIDIDEAVEVRAPRRLELVSVDELVDHMSGITLTETQREAAARILRGSIRGLERRLNRKFRPTATTETVVGDVTGWAPLQNSPVISIDTIDGQPLAAVPTYATDVWAVSSLTGLYQGSYSLYDHTPNGVFVGQFTRRTVGYTGGFGLDLDELADVRLAIMEKCAGVMTNRHDDTMSVKELQTRDDSTNARIGRKLESVEWSEEDLIPFLTLKRRVVV